MGVSILPRLAAMVWSATTGMRSSFPPAMERIITAKGTKVISATSLVISMAEKKQRAVNSRQSCRVVCMRERSFVPRYWNRPML